MGNEPSTDKYLEDTNHRSSSDDDNKPDGCGDECNHHVDVPPSNDEFDSSTAMDMTNPGRLWFLYRPDWLQLQSLRFVDITSLKNPLY